MHSPSQAGKVISLSNFLKYSRRRIPSKYIISPGAQKILFNIVCLQGRHYYALLARTVTHRHPVGIFLSDLLPFFFPVLKRMVFLVLELHGSRKYGCGFLSSLPRLIDRLKRDQTPTSPAATAGQIFPGLLQRRPDWITQQTLQAGYCDVTGMEPASAALPHFGLHHLRSKTGRGRRLRKRNASKPEASLSCSAMRTTRVTHKNACSSGLVVRLALEH